MRILVYDYLGEIQKAIITPLSCRVYHVALGDLYVSIECQATDYYKGDLRLGDRVRVPYPCELETNGNDFRVTEISTDEDVLTLKAVHRTFDFSNAVCTRWNTSEMTLSNYVAMLNDVIDTCNKAYEGETLTPTEQALYNVKRIENSHGIRFGYYKHDDEDVRYTTPHACGINAMSGNSILQHIAVTYAPNVIRDGNLLVLTYGTESQYFRFVYGLPSYAPIYKANTNVVGYTTENKIDGYVTSIAATSTFPVALDSEEKAEQFVGFVTNTAISSSLAYRYMNVVNYASDVDVKDYTSYTDYKTALFNDVLAQAQKEVNSYAWEGQNVTVESIATNDYIFGGEASVCADMRTHTDYYLAIESYEYDALTRRYENIQLGRATASLSDLATGVASGGGSSSGAGGGGLTFAQILELFKTNYLTVNGIHSMSGVLVDGTTNTKGLNVNTNTATLRGGFISYANSQSQRELMVGNAGTTDESLKLWDVRSSTTYSVNKTKNGYVVLPWGMVLAWGRQTITLSNGSGVIDLPIKMANLLNVTANASTSTDAWVNVGNPVAGVTSKHPNGYITVKVYEISDGEISYPSGSYSIMYQAIGY